MAGNIINRTVWKEGGGCISIVEIDCGLSKYIHYLCTENLFFTMLLR